GWLRATLHASEGLSQRDASDRWADRPALDDQHLDLGAEEHVAAADHRLPRAHVRGEQHPVEHVPDVRDVHSPRDLLPRDRLDALHSDPIPRAPPRAPGGAVIPDWFRPIAEYMLREGLPEKLRLGAISVVASLLVGILLGTLMTIRFEALRWLIRAYVEVWRGLPILVTILFIYWLPG